MRRGFQRHPEAHQQRRRRRPRTRCSPSFNPSPYPRSEVVTAFVDLPDEPRIDAFTIADAARQRVAPPGGLALRRGARWCATSPTPAWSCPRSASSCTSSAEDMPGAGLQDLSLLRREEPSRLAGEPGHRPAHDGERAPARAPSTTTARCCVTDKADRPHLRWPALLRGRRRDRPRLGAHDARVRRALITSHGCPAEIELEESGPLLARYRVDYLMQIPDGPRGSATTACTAAAPRKEMLRHARCITLRRGAQALEVRTTLRQPVPLPPAARCLPDAASRRKVSAAEAAFDVIERRIERGPESPYYNRENPTYPRASLRGRERRRGRAWRCSTTASASTR